MTAPRLGRPPTGETPKRYFRAPDSLWSEVAALAKQRGETITAFVLRAVEREVRRVRRQIASDKEDG